MVKDIVVSLAHGGTHDPACDYAVSVAETLQAHLAGIAFAYEPVIAPSAMAGISVELIDAQREESEKAADAALSRFEQATNRAGISVERHRFSESAAGAAALFGRTARMFDLVVVGQTNSENNAYEDLIIESALFDSGRPVIVVPYIQKEPLKLGRVVLCWDGGRTAARAVADAMPLLEQADKVDLVSISQRPGSEKEIPGVDVAEHIARHGVKVAVQRIVSDIDVAASILSYAADSAADLLVMGAYGHSRLREFILGGVTRGILQSMTVPVLMSH
jgi:nucleotide-binding universal stress UspA family protein